MFPGVVMILRMAVIKARRGGIMARYLALLDQQDLPTDQPVHLSIATKEDLVQLGHYNKISKIVSKEIRQILNTERKFHKFGDK